MDPMYVMIYNNKAVVKNIEDIYEQDDGFCRTITFQRVEDFLNW
jgi:hypothetical protein